MIDLDKLHQQLAESRASIEETQMKIDDAEVAISLARDRKALLQKNALKDGTEIETLQAQLNESTGITTLRSIRPFYFGLLRNTFRR